MMLRLRVEVKRVYSLFCSCLLGGCVTNNSDTVYTCLFISACMIIIELLTSITIAHAVTLVDYDRDQNYKHLHVSAVIETHRICSAGNRRRGIDVKLRSVMR